MKGWLGKMSLRSIKGHIMGGPGKSKKPKLPRKDDDKSKKSPPAPIEEEDFEDGDFATPKRDRNGEDDQPL
ncbi:hypothetical protein [Bradyrhizobium sp. URHD0069]|uniref:hypothetical protein n=1 Tax=Bradyrhizobium sp. URHD0069 TaxID=1380355 RepID=UPI00055D92A7|nr:hypothetical protein [Bradyrhizobium sp. URHD0069]